MTAFTEALREVNVKPEMREVMRLVTLCPNWRVTRSHGGHLKFWRGDLLVASGSSTPSDSRSALNLRAQLLRNGLREDLRGNGYDSKGRRWIEAPVAHPEPDQRQACRPSGGRLTNMMRAFLMENPDRVWTHDELVDRLQDRLTEAQVRSLTQRFRKRGELATPWRGHYQWVGEREADPEPEPAPPELFETVTTDSRGRLVLKDETGELWLAARLPDIDLTAG